MSVEKSAQLTFATKVQKEYPDFCAEVDSLQVDSLNERLLRYAKYKEEIEDLKQADTKLANAKDLVAELTAPHRDAKKAVEMKMRYICNMIKEKGGV